MPPKRRSVAALSRPTSNNDNNGVPAAPLDDVVEKLSVVRGKLWTVRNKITAFDGELVSARSALLDAKLKYLELRQTADDKSRELQEMEKKAESSEATLKNYEALINEFPAIFDELEESLSCNSKSARDRQEMLQNFIRQSNIAPWSVEKRQYLHCLQEDENRLEITKRQIAALEQKIKEKKQLVEQHREYSFQKFCFMLAGFLRNQRSLYELLEKEEAINRDLRVRAAAMTSSEEFDVIDDVYFSSSKQARMASPDDKARLPAPVQKSFELVVPARSDQSASIPTAQEKEKNAWQGIVETSGETYDRDSLTSLTSSAEEERNEIDAGFATDDENNDTEVENENDEENEVVCVAVKPIAHAKASRPPTRDKSVSFNFFDNFNPTLNYSNEKNPFGF